MNKRAQKINIITHHASDSTALGYWKEKWLDLVYLLHDI